MKLEGVEPPLGDAYSLWRETAFSIAQRSNAAVSGPDADPDGDGLGNLFEYGLGSNPFEADADLVPTSELAGGVLRFDYKRPITTHDLVYRVEWSDTLANGSWSAAGLTEKTLSEAAGIRQVRASVPMASSGSHRFARLSVMLHD